MHIVQAFEAAQKNRDAVNKKIMDMAMDAAKEGNVELAQKLNDLTDDVNKIIEPFTQ